MTHDELLAELQWRQESVNPQSAVEQSMKALRAVVELHKPDQYNYCIECGTDQRNNDQPVIYPCSTIQAIEGQLG